jgi:hypothetical protein
MPSPLQAIYQEREKQFGTELTTVKRRINVLSNLRLATAFLIVITMYFTFKNERLAVLPVLLIPLFGYFVQRHAGLFHTKAHLENLVRINVNEQKALRGIMSGMDPGSEFIDPHHQYAHDLDLFGEGSLFQYISRCTTIQGRKKLATHLEHLQSSKVDIADNQQAIQDLVHRIDFRQHFQAGGMETGEQAGDHLQLLEWVARPSLFSNPRLIQFALWLIPAFTIGALVATFFFTGAKLFLTAMIICQWSITGLMLKKINVFHDYITRKKNILQKYSRLLYYLETEKFASQKLISLSLRAQKAHAKVNQLAKLVSALDARTNSMTTFIVNSLLLYDLQCVFRLEKWKEQNSLDLRGWLDAITEVEMLSSLGTFACNNPSFAFASVGDSLAVNARAMGHPLINEEERVLNDFSLGPESSVMIVTGANMAGKSTFLRTLGINMILALNGAPVCASEFQCPIIQLRSGMRTADSLKDHQSYFYAELNRLKTIMDELRKDTPVLILLDEILKGTNSNDKQAGSIALVRQLLPHPCLAVIATHDLALSDLEKEFPRKISNYCFEANIENEQLSFDYKLKRGVAQKMNASFLMKKMGIIP